MRHFGDSFEEFALVIVDLVPALITTRKKSLGTLVYDLHPFKYHSCSHKVSFIPPKGDTIACPVGVPFTVFSLYTYIMF